MVVKTAVGCVYARHTYAWSLGDEEASDLCRWPSGCADLELRRWRASLLGVQELLYIRGHSCTRHFNFIVFLSC